MEGGGSIVVTTGGGECPKTHLMCRQPPTQKIFRIAKRSYGPMNPALRAAGVDVESWGRFDVAGHRTIYGASPTEATYGESLASLRPSPQLGTTRLGDLFDPDDELDSDMSLQDAITRDWDGDHRFPPGAIAAAWRNERLIYALTPPTNGWFIDLEHARSLRAVEESMGADTLSKLGHTGHLTIGDLRGNNRALTTAIAQWVWEQELESGAAPHGIVYGSKLDSGWRCWAIWLRRVDRGATVDVEPTRSDAGSTILPVNHNDALKTVTDAFGLTVH